MKLYTYSSELHAYVESRWAITKFVTCGILIGTIILFGAMTLKQSEVNASGSRSANILAEENDFLRQQLSLMSPRVSKLEMQARQLDERANKLQMRLLRRTIVRDTVTSFADATK
jgi:hypothetical protein